MTTRTIEIKSLCTWRGPRRVQTRRGPRDLFTAVAPTEEFWDAWRDAKEQLKDAGIQLTKENGEWAVLWWRPVGEAEAAKTHRAIADSYATDADIDIPCPPGLAYLPFQRAGIKYASERPNCLIADEMGLGKTIQAIGVIQLRQPRHVLVICPASLRLNWARELAKWAPSYEVHVVVGGGKKAWPEIDGPTVVIINYDVVAKHRERIDQTYWDLLVCDESQYLKSPEAARTIAVLGQRENLKRNKEHIPGIKCGRRLMLSGTPILNRPVELWSTLQAMDPEGLGKSWWHYVHRYCDAKDTGWGLDTSGASNLEELQRLLRETVMVRRLKEQVLTDLPPKRRQILEIPANGASGAIAAEQAAMAQYEEQLLALQVYVELAKAADDDDYELARAQLREACQVAFTELSRARHEVALAKLDYVVEHLDEAIQEHPVVLFAWHTDVIRSLAESFRDRCVVVTGETPLAQRQEAVDRFQHGDVPLFLGNIQAAGVGITLTAASHVVFAELPWRPADLSQAEDRCHRIGQRSSVLVQHIVLSGSLDERMAATLVRKQEVIEQALDHPSDDDWVAPVDPPATIELTPSATTQAAAQITPAQVAAVHHALRVLAGLCDGAQQLDGVGFNKVDTRIGKSLAENSEINARQAVLGQQIIRKYHRQLGDDLLQDAGVTLTKE